MPILDAIDEKQDHDQVWGGDAPEICSRLGNVKCLLSLLRDERMRSEINFLEKCEHIELANKEINWLVARLNLRGYGLVC
jgi:hypothetical protein